MDPTSNHQEQIWIASRMLTGDGRPSDPDRLAELVMALNQWVHSGGVLPMPWSRHWQRVSSVAR